jgi:hypothetical protein
MMVYRNVALAFASSLVMLSGLYGCSNKNSHNTPPYQPPSTPLKTQNTAPSNTPEQHAAATVPALSKADLTVPLSSYQQLEMDTPHWMAMYYGIANVNPLPFGKFADAMVNGYQYEQDPFKKRDELKQITPEVTQMVNASAKNRYYFILANVRVGNYNMKTKAFPIHGFSDNSSYQQGNYGLTFSNGSQFSSYPVIDQTTAENLENTIQSMGNELLAKVYFYAQSTEYSMPNLPGYTTVGQITKVVFYPENNTNRKLFELGSAN